MSYFILSLDGGGIRGVLTAALLTELQRQKPFLERVDLFAGTSTGGILSLGLAMGLSPDRLMRLYSERGHQIFGNRDLLDTVLFGADEVYRADYGTEAIKKVLSDEFGATTLGQLQKRVLVSSFDLESGTTGQWKPKFFHNYESEGNDRTERVVDVALRTSAAPTYFPSYQGFIDGGVVANNPAVCALAKAVKAGAALPDIKLLSVGTGFNPHRIGGAEHDWGKAQWATRILELTLEGSLDVPHYQCEQLLHMNYHRLQVTLPRPFPLDAVDSVPALLDLVNVEDVKRKLAAAVAFL